MTQDSLKTEWQILILFLLTFLGDFGSALWLKDGLNLSFLVKAFLIGMLFWSMLKDKRIFIVYISVGYIMLLIGMAFNYHGQFLNKTAQFFEYYSGVIVFGFLIKKNKTVLLDKLILYIFLFYILNIIVAVLLNIEYFKTYSGSNRFGYMPMFNSQNEFSFIAITSVAYFYKRLIGSKKFINYAFLITTIIAVCCIGTKVVYIFIFIFLNYLLFKKLGKKKYLMIIFLLAIINYFLRNEWYNFFNNHFKVLVNVYEKNGILDAISSLRLTRLHERFLCQTDNFDVINHAFGGSLLNCITEMSLFDLFFFFGFVGMGWFIYLQYKLLLKPLRFDSFGYVYVISIVLLSFVAGYYFENFTPQLYAMSFLYLFYYEHKDSFQKKESVK